MYILFNGNKLPNSEIIIIIFIKELENIKKDFKLLGINMADIIIINPNIISGPNITLTSTVVIINEKLIVLKYNAIIGIIIICTDIDSANVSFM